MKDSRELLVQVESKAAYIETQRRIKHTIDCRIGKFKMYKRECWFSVRTKARTEYVIRAIDELTSIPGVLRVTLLE